MNWQSICFCHKKHVHPKDSLHSLNFAMPDVTWQCARVYLYNISNTDDSWQIEVLHPRDVDLLIEWGNAKCVKTSLQLSRYEMSRDLLKINCAALLSPLTNTVCCFLTYNIKMPSPPSIASLSWILLSAL